MMMAARCAKMILMVCAVCVGCRGVEKRGYDLMEETQGIYSRAESAVADRRVSEPARRFQLGVHGVQLWAFDSSQIYLRACSDQRVFDSLQGIAKEYGIMLIRDGSGRGGVRDVPCFRCFPSDLNRLLRPLDSGYFDMVSRSQGVEDLSEACRLICMWDSVRIKGDHEMYIRANEWRNWMLLKLLHHDEMKGGERCRCVSDSAVARMKSRDMRTARTIFREIW